MKQYYTPQIQRTYRWDEVERLVLTIPKHADLRVERWMVPHPLYAGYVKAPSNYDGQMADYRKALRDRRGIHVKEYNDFYLVHWDARDPTEDPLGHLWHDAPHWLAIGIIALGFLLSALKDDSR